MLGTSSNRIVKRKFSKLQKLNNIYKGVYFMTVLIFKITNNIVNHCIVNVLAILKIPVV